MTIERELLQRAKILLDCVCTSPVQKEIEELLAQPEPEPEPDLWVVTNPWGVNEYLWSEPREQVYENYKVTKFYRLPPPTREPLSELEIYRLYENAEYLGFLAYKKGIKDAEKAHNIGVNDE